MSDITLNVDTVHSSYVTPITIAPALVGMPELAGMGRLRDLRQAATLSESLANVLGNVASETSRSVQAPLIDAMLVEWSRTDPLYTTGGIVYHPGSGGTSSGSSINVVFLRPGQTFTFSSDGGVTLAQDVVNKIRVVEAFRGGELGGHLWAGQSDSVETYMEAYKAIAAAVSGSIALQTRLKPYADAVSLKVDSTGVSLDYSGQLAVFDSRFAENNNRAIAEFGEWVSLARSANRPVMPELYEKFGEWYAAVGSTPAVSAAIAEMGAVLASVNVSTGAAKDIIFVTNANLTIQAGAGNDQVLGSSGIDAISGGEGDDFLKGMGGNDTISDSSGSDAIDGGDGDDTITDSGSGTNTLRGGNGNDNITYSYNANNTVEGGAGDDTLSTNSFGNSSSYSSVNTFAGGTGTDRIKGGYGADTYLFNRGDGADTIVEYGASDYADKIVFGAGIAAADVKVTRSGANLVLTVTDPANPGATDSITIESWVSSDVYTIEQLVFADGTTMSKAQLVTAMNTIVGSAAADTLSGSSEIGSIHGMGGNDIITDAGGNDTIDGGDGDDSITDSGSGTNTLRGGNGNDNITYSYNANNTVEGGAGDDTLSTNSFGNSSSYSSVNTFAGGTGTDRIKGGYGADTYLFNRGDGADTIVEYGASDYADKIVFGAGIAKSDLSAARSGNNLVVTIGNSQGLTAESVTVESWFSSTVYEVEQFVLNDGTILTSTQVVALIGIPPG